MKKWKYPLTGLTATALLLGVLPTSASLAEPPQALQVSLNNNLVNFPDAKPFVDENDRTMVPVRFIAEGIGAKVDWYGFLNSVVINLNGKEIRLRIGEDTATINGAPTKLDTKAVMKEERTFVPLRFVSETLGADVKWDGEKNLVLISFNGSAGDNPDAHPSPTTGDLWGRQTRTTNLPKNAADFPYILADLPNAMYEMPYKNETGDPLQTPKEIFATEPQVTKANIDLWMDKVKRHYQLVLNADYHTIDYAWADQLSKTVSGGTRYKTDFNKYVDWVKQNHIQIEGSLEPEPSFIYKNWSGYNVRSKVKFRIVSFDQDKNVMNDDYYVPGIYQKGVWYSGYADTTLITTTMGNWGPTLAVSALATIFDNESIQPMK